MSDARDFEIDAGELRSAADLPADSSMASASGSDLAPAPAPTPRPMVVIQYRNRGIHRSLLPPLLILLTALVITSYQRQARLRPLSPPATPAKSAATADAPGQGRTILVEPSGTGAAVGPIMVRAETPLPPPPIPSPAPAAMPKGEEAIARADDTSGPLPFSPFDRDAQEVPPPLVPGPGREIAVAPPLEPPAPPTSPAGERLPADSPELAFRDVAEPVTAPIEPPPAEPRLTREQILQGIQAESKQKKAEQKNLEREVANSKIREYWEMFRKMNTERLTFHEDLRNLLQRMGNEAADEINALCDRYGRTLLPDVEKALGLAMKRTGAKFNRGRRIEMMRSYGVPEAAVLESLSKEMELRINTRGGPRDRNEALVDAADLLLKYPPRAADGATAHGHARSCSLHAAIDGRGRVAPGSQGDPQATIKRSPRDAPSPRPSPKGAGEKKDRSSLPPRGRG